MSLTFEEKRENGKKGLKQATKHLTFNQFKIQHRANVGALNISVCVHTCVYGESDYMAGCVCIIA